MFNQSLIDRWNALSGMRRRVFGWVFFVFVGLILSTSISNAQWSRDPAEALLVGQGDMVSDSLGGVFLATTDFPAWNQSAYALWVNSEGEIPWGEWQKICPAAAASVYEDHMICTEPGYVVIHFAAAWINGDDTTYDLRAQKLNTDGELMWGEEGLRVIEREWSDGDSLLFGATDLIGDGSSGTIFTYAYRWPPMFLTVALFAQRMNADGELLWGDGATIIDEFPRHNVTSRGHVPDGNNGAIIRVNWPDTMVFQRLNEDGDRLWDENGQVYPLSHSLQGYGYSSDGRGGLMFTARFRYDGRERIFLFRFDSDGEELLGDGGGREIYNAPIEAGIIPSMIKVADEEFNIGFSFDLDYEAPHPRVLRVSLDGELLWEDNGVRVSQSDSGQYRLAGVPSDSGSVVYIWKDLRVHEEISGSIFCQRLDEHGERIWDDSDVLLFHRSGTRILKIVSDCNGGAIVSFYVGRTYLQMINKNGELGMPLSVPDVNTPYLAENITFLMYPNPTNGSSIIQFDTPISSGINIAIFDLQGRIIQNTRIDDHIINTFPIELTHFPAGTYIIQARNNKSICNNILQIAK